MKPLQIKNTVFGDGVPKICIPVTGRTEEQILEAAKQIFSLPHEVVEWRADYYENVCLFHKVDEILTALRKILPNSLLLFTFRTHKEGGVRELSEKTYLELCAHVAESGLADLLDLELFIGCSAPDCNSSPSEKLRALIRFAHENDTRIILSNHDFQKTPPAEELGKRLVLMEQLGADLAKLAVMPRTPEDVTTLLTVTCQASSSLHCPVITMSMGSMGTVSRVSGRLTGSCMTFGSAGEASAPGQLYVKKLAEILEIL